jgi:hypothetical protein
MTIKQEKLAALLFSVICLLLLLCGQVAAYITGVSFASRTAFKSKQSGVAKVWYQTNSNNPSSPSAKQHKAPELNVTKLLLASPEEIEPLIDLFTIPAPVQAVESFPHVDVGTDLRNACDTFECTIFDFDTGHDGQFTVFGSAGASLNSDAVFAQTKLPPLSYIRDVLSFGDDHVINNDAAGNGREAVVFCGPGLNTLHDQAVEMVKYASKVLDGVPMAHLHAASYLDRGNAVVEGNELETLFVGTDTGTSTSSAQANSYTIRAEDRDKIKMVLSGRNLIDTPFKNTVMKLLDVAVASLQHDDDSNTKQQPNLVLLCYSATSAEIAAAIQTWLDHAAETSQNLQYAELLLRKAVTVVTLGATAQNFPDGPAYIHVSMNDDTIVKTFGVSSSTPKEWGGKDAMYLHAHSPYYYASPLLYKETKAHDSMTLDDDAHNLQACLVQWLAIIMRINGARSFRFLYNVMATDRLDNPPNLEQEVFPAMIRATAGHEWLWVFGGEDDGSIIMPTEEAKMVIEWQYGYDAYEEIVEAMQEKNGLFS